MIVIVTGGRDYINKQAVFRKLSRLKEENNGLLIVAQGGCPTGADAFAREWNKLNGRTGITFDAPWDRAGKSAGPLRNAVMAFHVAAMAKGFGREGVCIWFPGNEGTDNMKREAGSAGLRLIEGEAV